MDQRSRIQEFPASRRARISPQSVGLPVAGRKWRVPGLRREEVAALAGLSVDYSIRLERGAPQREGREAAVGRHQHAGGEVRQQAAGQGPLAHGEGAEDRTGRPPGAERSVPEVSRKAMWSMRRSRGGR
jgi:hypothetical protein